MGLETTRRGNSGKKTDKGGASKNGAAQTSAGNMPGTGDEDEDDLIVSKTPPPANGTYRARVGRCYFMRRKATTPGGKGERVCDKEGNPLPPKLEMIIDDPKEQAKLLAHEPSQHQRPVQQLMNLEGNWRSRTNELAAGLGFPESEWPVKTIKNPKGKDVEHLIFPMGAIDALSEKVEGKYKYFEVTCTTTSGEGSEKGTPYTNITAIKPWIDKDKTAKAGKNKAKIEPDPKEPAEDEEQDEETSTESGADEEDKPPVDDDIPF